MLLGTLGASLLGNLLTSNEVTREGEGTIKNRSGFLKPSHPLSNFELQNYYQNKLKFNGIYSSNNLPKIKDMAYLINFDEYKLIGTHWIASYVNVDITIIYKIIFYNCNITLNYWFRSKIDNFI